MKDFKFKPSFYRTLCIDRNSTSTVMKKSYRDLLMMYHPDKHQQNEVLEKEANAKTLEIQLAYSVLSNPKLRPLYDELLDKYELEEKRKAEAIKGVKFNLSGLRNNAKDEKKVVVNKEVKLDPEMEMMKTFLDSLRTLVDEMKKYQNKNY